MAMTTRPSLREQMPTASYRVGLCLASGNSSVLKVAVAMGRWVTSSKMVRVGTGPVALWNAAKRPWSPTRQSQEGCWIELCTGRLVPRAESKIEKGYPPVVQTTKRPPGKGRS
jgi:hypothetical protein